MLSTVCLTELSKFFPPLGHVFFLFVTYSSINKEEMNACLKVCICRCEIMLQLEVHSKERVEFDEGGVSDGL